MKQNGEVSGKKSVSDWMNRMNDMIRRKTEEPVPSKERKEKNPVKSSSKKRSGGSESSNC